jgi:hypothetical protein
LSLPIDPQSIFKWKSTIIEYEINGVMIGAAINLKLTLTKAVFNIYYEYNHLVTAARIPSRAAFIHA